MANPVYKQSRSLASVTVLLTLSMVTLAALWSQGCRSAPISGRKQLVLLPESQEIQLGSAAYEEALADQPVSDNAELVAMVERVGQRIAAVANKPEYDWEFRLIATDVKNAFALPGGKVAVYEGILPICQSEAGLAVVMAHEVAHALARHGGERMSQQSVASGVGAVVNAVSQRKTDEATTGKIMQAYGVVSHYGATLPFSRKHESEADAIGLILMARAGYDPSVAPEFWERFSATSGTKPPEWLSTHPADARRAADLRALLPEAMKYYESAPEQYGMGDAIPTSRLTYAAATEATSTSNQALQPAGFRQFGHVEALTGEHSVKRGVVSHALHTEWDVGDENPPEAHSTDSGHFELPVTEGTPLPTDSDTAEGWVPHR